MRKIALGIGIMSPRTIIDILKLKLFIGNKQKTGNAYDSIKIQEDYQQIEASRNITIGENSELRYWKETWIDEVNDLLWEQKLRLESPSEESFFDTKNKTVIEYTIDYVERKKLYKNILY